MLPNKASTYTVAEGAAEDLVTVFDTQERFMAKKSLQGDVDYLLRRKMNVDVDIHQQAYPNFWLLLRAHNFAPNRFMLQVDGTVISPSGSFYIYLPARTLSHWRLNPGFFEYETYISFTPADDSFPTRPVVFPFEKSHPLQGYDDIANLLSAYKDAPSVRSKKSCAHAEKTKRFVDDFFIEDIPLSEMAQELRVAQSTMTINFKNQYGIPPVQYRNILRTFESMHLIREGRSVTAAGFDSGFQSLAQYSVHFKRHFLMPPSQFMRMAT